MHAEQFNRIFETQVEKCRSTLGVKANEYATDDRLHNFKVAADLQGITPREALGGMLAKHIVSIFDMISSEDGLAPLPVWEEKLGDALNYLFLLKAVVIDEMDLEVEMPVRLHPSYDPSKYNSISNIISADE